MPLMRVGQVVGAFGIKGQVKVEPLTDWEGPFEPGRRLRLKGEWVDVLECFWHKGRPTLRLSGVDDRNAAESLQWEYLEAPEAFEPDDAFRVQDLIGLTVRTTEDEVLGAVDDVLNYPGQDLLIVGELMIPMVREFIREIDLQRGFIRVFLLPGMRPGENVD